MGVWDQLVSQTKRASRDHAALSEIYASHIVQRCNNINDDLQRMYKKVRPSPFAESFFKNKKLPS
jgi:SLIT-ROBO Rho GTPase activating protein